MRDRKSRFLRNDVVGNPYIWGALILSIFLLLIATYAPGLSDVLNTVHPGARGWAVIVGLSLVPWMVGQILKQTGTL
jgi:Ca2+-transporting ATPase